VSLLLDALSARLIAGAASRSSWRFRGLGARLAMPDTA